VEVGLLLGWLGGNLQALNAPAGACRRRFYLDGANFDGTDLHIPEKIRRGFFRGDRRRFLDGYQGRWGAGGKAKLSNGDFRKAEDAVQ